MFLAYPTLLRSLYKQAINGTRRSQLDFQCRHPNLQVTWYIIIPDTSHSRTLICGAKLQVALVLNTSEWIRRSDTISPQRSLQTATRHTHLLNYHMSPLVNQRLHTTFSLNTVYPPIGGGTQAWLTGVTSTHTHDRTTCNNY